jgi:hypothetical protein
MKNNYHCKLKKLFRFIGIGFDTRFVQPFVEGGFFKGGYYTFYFFSLSLVTFLIIYFFTELYVDTDKSCYTALQYPTFSYFTLIKNLFKWNTKSSYVS